MYTFESPYVSGPEDPVTIVVSIEVKPGTEQRIEDHMAAVIPTNRSEEGCLEFSFFKVQGKTGHYVLFEKWKNQPALSWHMEQQYTQDVFAMLEETLSYPMSDVLDHIKFVEEIAPVFRLSMRAQKVS